MKFVIVMMLRIGPRKYCNPVVAGDAHVQKWSSILTVTQSGGIQTSRLTRTVVG